MRLASALALTIFVTGCGGDRQPGEAAKAQTTSASTRRCTHVSRGFRACTVFGAAGERSRIERRDGARWAIVAPPNDRPGWWRRIVASADRTMLLAQWSGECEVQSTYLVSTGSGRARAILRSKPSTAIGWSKDRRARVRLQTPLYGSDRKVRYRAGVYLVDPVTLAVSLERPGSRKPGC
jgi:hypothetical protein